MQFIKDIDYSISFFIYLNMKNIEFLKTSLIIHSGQINNRVIENTIPAFIKCASNKNIIELDIHILSDNTIVVYHDFNLKRLCDVNKIIETLSYTQLCKYKIKNKYTISTLEQVMHIIKGKTPILIDIKDLNNNNKFEVELLKLLDNYGGDVAIQSVNPYVLKWLKKSKYPIGQIINSYSNINLLSILFNKLINKINFISYNIKNLDQKISDRLRKKFFLIGWTVKTKDELKTYAPFCDNLICEKIL